MNKTKASPTVRLGLIVFCLGLSACKPEETVRTPLPDVSMNEKASPAPVRAAAEVVEEKGPVRLTLRLLKTRIPESEHSLWVKIIITNTGDSRMLVLDDVFQKGPQDLRHYTDVGLFLEIRDAQDKKPFWLRPEDHYPPRECWPDDFGPDREEDASFWLAAGKSTGTPAMAYQRLKDAWCYKEARPKPIGDFGEIRGYYFSPGKYRVRAVFNQSGMGRIRQEEYGEAPDPYHIRVVTPWIELEVTP